MNKWDAVFEDVEFAKQIIALSPEDAQKALAERGFDFSMQEIMEAGKEISELMRKTNFGELDEEALSDVSGGAVGWNFKTGFVVGAVVAAGIICGW